jgi:hypothetical protein
LKYNKFFRLKNSVISFMQTTHMLHNQSNCKNRQRARGPPAEWVNWTKWSRSKKGSAEEIPTQDLMRLHNGAKTGQKRNKWCAVSSPPQPITQNLESGGIMCRLTKLSLVSNLLRSNRHASTETFKGTCLYHNYIFYLLIFTNLQFWLLNVHNITFGP